MNEIVFDFGLYCCSFRLNIILGDCKCNNFIFLLGPCEMKMKKLPAKVAFQLFGFPTELLSRSCHFPQVISHALANTLVDLLTHVMYCHYKTLILFLGNFMSVVFNA